MVADDLERERRRTASREAARQRIAIARTPRGDVSLVRPDEAIIRLRRVEGGEDAARAALERAKLYTGRVASPATPTTRASSGR